MTGTGSGVGNDNFLLQEFDRAIEDSAYTVLYAEDAKGNGLGMVIIGWTSATETCAAHMRMRMLMHIHMHMHMRTQVRADAEGGAARALHGCRADSF